MNTESLCILFVVFLFIVIFILAFNIENNLYKNTNLVKNNNNTFKTYTWVLFNENNMQIFLLHRDCLDSSGTNYKLETQHGDLELISNAEALSLFKNLHIIGQL